MTGRLSRRFPRVARQRAGVLPLRGEAERRGVGTGRIWFFVVELRVRELDAEPVEQREVGAHLDLARRLRLELRVAGLAERATGRAAAVRLVLRDEAAASCPPFRREARRRKSLTCGTCKNGSSDTRHTPDTRPNGAHRLPAPNSELPS